MKTGRSRARAAWLTLAGALLALSAATAGCSDEKTGAASTPTPTVAEAATPSLPPEPSPTARASGRDKLRALNPKWDTFIRAVESADLTTITAYLAFEAYPCTPDVNRDGHASRCSELGQPNGAELQMFREDDRGAVPIPGPGAGWYRDATQMASALRLLLEGRHPTLSMIVHGDQGEIYLGFTIDAGPGPWASGSTVVSVSFLGPVGTEVKLSAFAQGVSTTTPRETFGGEVRRGHSFDVWQGQGP